MDLADDAYAEIRQWLRRFDPRHEDIEGMWQRLGYIDVQHLAPRIAADVLMVTGLMDTICPPSTQFAAYNRIEAPKEMLVYPDFEHEDMPGRDDRVLAFLVDRLTR
jgi:cephalosporin-C deacetylase